MAEPFRLAGGGVELWFGGSDTPIPPEPPASTSKPHFTIAIAGYVHGDRVFVRYVADGQNGQVELGQFRKRTQDDGTALVFVQGEIIGLRAGAEVQYSIDFERRTPRIRLSSADDKSQIHRFLYVGKGSRRAVKLAVQPLSAAAIATPVLTTPPSEASKQTDPGDVSAGSVAASAAQLPANALRIGAINAILSSSKDGDALKAELDAANGDWTAALAGLKSKLSSDAFSKIELAHSLAVWSDDNTSLLKAVLASKPKLTGLRDLALQFNVDGLAALIDPKAVPLMIQGDAPSQKQRNYAVELRRRLFWAEPSAVAQRMIADIEIPLGKKAIQSAVVNVLSIQPDFNIRTTSVYTALKHPGALKGIADEDQAAVIGALKSLQRVLVISPVPEAIPALMKANLTSAMQIAAKPESTFIKAFGATFGEATARQLHANAVNVQIRNEQALVAMRQMVRGTGLAMVDGKQGKAERLVELQKIIDEKSLPLNLETMFGSPDLCECEDCLSLYSPASYFVELLEFLRNNNLDPNNDFTGQKDIKGTPVEKLFRRRPDLGCLELTCKNTFTVLPYIDLVNEVMESFVVHREAFKEDTHEPKQVTLDAFNVDKETSGELLASPQNVDYGAYEILMDAVHPFTLPYHQAIDAIRIFLGYIGTSRWELLDKFRTPNAPSMDSNSSGGENETLSTQDKAVDAEYLGLTETEYLILTQSQLRPTHEYYGYDSQSDMLSLDEDESTGQKGLTFVKKQFLPRTGIQYSDLVELLKTRFINRKFPQGQDLTVLENIRYSYRFLQSLVIGGSQDPEVKFGSLIKFLKEKLYAAPILGTFLEPDACPHSKSGKRSTRGLEGIDVWDWVHNHFERLGKLIILESGTSPSLPVEGRIVSGVPPQAIGPNPIVFERSQLLGKLHMDGKIVAANGKLIGNISPEGIALALDGRPFANALRTASLLIVDEQGRQLASIEPSGLYDLTKDKVKLGWLPARDICDIEKVRLSHLDGTPLKEEEYDRLHRFIRLWRKLGWTIDETDKALSGLAVSGNAASTPVTNGNGGPDPADSTASISSEFLHQLRAVKKLQAQTGLPLVNLLAFWADISTAGEKSLYAKLFLTHNLAAIDSVFQADANGNYLSQSDTLSDHIPILMAALKLKADDISAIAKIKLAADGIAFDDPLTLSLTLPNVSFLYRYSLLIKLLRIKSSALQDVISIFGDPFKDAWTTLHFLETWKKIEGAGFSFAQFDYLILGNDDPLRPIGPSQKAILQLAKTLYDGLNAIEQNHPDIKEGDVATSDLVRAKAGLLFEQPVVERIIGLLEGTTVNSYASEALSAIMFIIPARDAPNDMKVVPASDALSDLRGLLPKKLVVGLSKDTSPQKAFIQLTGILADSERLQAESLSADPEWSKAIKCASQAPELFFTSVLSGIFSDPEAVQQLLAGDVVDPDNPQNNTAPGKRLGFLKEFLPYLREQLAQRLIVETVSPAVSLPGDITRLLLSEILQLDGPEPSAMKALANIKDQPSNLSDGWQGYLIPPADDIYTFVNAGDTPAADLLLEGQALPFVEVDRSWNPCSGEPRRWSTDQQELKNGALYLFTVAPRPVGKLMSELKWKTPTSPLAAIPSSALLPDYASAGTKEVFTRLFKAALVINGFNLSLDEIRHLQNSGSKFGNFNLSAMTLSSWQRLQAYTKLRNNQPRRDTRLIDLFAWAAHPDDQAHLSAQIAEATGWTTVNIDKLITHFDLNRPDAFLNEISLAKMRDALVIADKIGVDIDRLFDWAKPESDFDKSHKIAEDIRSAIRARFDAENWEQIVKPLNDQLREHQKQALIAFLLVQPELTDWGVTDADSLFEFFLIDVQMDACMETSRIKQAISSVQLFIQRCLLGLEEKKNAAGMEIGVRNDVIDRNRWNWMQSYRLWEANRKVFLYPENWLVPELRDDKSLPYKELESELLQKDINPQTVQDALKSYLIKVDEVANLKVVGLHVEQAFDEDDQPSKDKDGKYIYTKLHVFARTRNAPYFYYYRYFDIAEGNWYPWDKVQVDIPSYDVEGDDGKVTDNGTYLIPVVWQSRLLIFFPQFLKKAAPNVAASGKKFNDILNENSPNDAKPKELWEIKMGWSEYRNGKWTQKQLSTEAIYNDYYGGFPSYQFIPRIVTSEHKEEIIIECWWGLSKYNIKGHERLAALQIGTFHFEGSQIRAIAELKQGVPIDQKTRFHYVNLDNSSTIYSLQAINDNSPSFFKTVPLVISRGSSSTAQFEKIVTPNSSEHDFYHPFVHRLLGKMGNGTLDDLFDHFESYYADARSDKRADVYGGHIDEQEQHSFHELKRAYAIYNWEATFHAPMFLVDRLLKANQFEQALAMLHFILNPYGDGDPGDDKRFWQFPPFKEIDAKNALRTLLFSLRPGQRDSKFNEWRNKPFQPHVVARGRPASYMIWVAVTYIKILIAWGDYLFRQDTIETINQATQLYILASHIYGPRPQKIPKQGKVSPRTYNSLLDKWDPSGNAITPDFEVAFPNSIQTPFLPDWSCGAENPANILGSAVTLYFCIPDNPEMMALRNTIDDRLLKIRHCENIEGVFRNLPLFEPPIDPSLLVQAAAQGLSLASVLNDFNSPMPNYRFYYLLQKALELCNELKSLGGALLSTKEKGDAEALSRLRATQESTVQNLAMEVKKKQLTETQKSLEALRQSRRAPVSRMQYYLQLIGEDLSKVPDDATDFEEIKNILLAVTSPISSWLPLNVFEITELGLAQVAAELAFAAGSPKALSGILYLIPELKTSLEPFGTGVSAFFGGKDLGEIAATASDVLQLTSSYTAHLSSQASRMAGFARQLQDRIHQANIAGYEIKSIDKQILAQQIRIDIAKQEVINQQKQIDDAKDVEDFLRRKYTNQELYSWMEGQVRTLYRQAYTLAYDLAKKAENAFRFERPDAASTTFIQYGYWDTGYNGLLAGERLYIGLKQLEAAYQEKRGYDFEITKNISLQQLNPLALIAMRQSGQCEFSLPEILFDMGFPGHYMRRIKSVALTFSCVVGPYTSINCTLRLLEHKFRTSAIAGSKNDYPERMGGSEDRFSTVNVPITFIAVSTGQNDSGVFELNFRDERYIPFEGAGAISKWRIELPDTFREFDYNSITDVVMHLRYTSLYGGDQLKKSAKNWLLDFIESVDDLSKEEGLFAHFDLKRDFPNEWYKATNLSSGETGTMNLGKLSERLPFFTKTAKRITATDLYLFAGRTNSQNVASISLVAGSETALNVNWIEPSSSQAVPSALNTQMKDNDWSLRISGDVADLEEIWLVVRYEIEIEAGLDRE